MNENKLGQNPIQEEFTVSLEKKNDKYEVATYTGTNTRDGMCLLKWATVAAEMTNIIISGQLPTDPAECLKVLETAIEKASTIIY